MRFFLNTCFSLCLVVVSSFVAAGAPVPEDAAAVCPIKIGQSVPELTLTGLDGKPVELKSVLGQAPTLMIFYRGSWCPYCNTHLGELKTVEKSLKKQGFQVVAVSPDLPKNLKESVDKNDLTYTLLSDSKATAAKAMGLAFKVDAETYKTYLGYGINLEKASGEDHHILPVPAAVLIDKKGVVRFVFSSPDYKVRVDSSVLLAAAEAMQK